VRVSVGLADEDLGFEAARYLKQLAGKVILLSHPLCDACKAYEETLKDEIKGGSIVKIDVSRDRRGKVIMEVLQDMLGIEGVPAIISVESEGGRITVCNVENERCVEVEEETPTQS